MPTELYGFIFALINFLLLGLFYKVFGKTGMICWIGFATILANLQVVKTVELFGLIVTLGNVMYATTFLATDLLNEKHGKQTARTAVWLGFATLFISTVIMQFVVHFPPHSEDLAQEHLAFIFDFALRIAAGSLIAYLISNHLNVYIFAFSKGYSQSRRCSGSAIVLPVLLAKPLIHSSFARSPSSAFTRLMSGSKLLSPRI